MGSLKPWWGQFDLVLSNPCIPASVVDDLDPTVRDHEPRLALDGGPDGLRCIRSILASKQAPAPEGCFWNTTTTKARRAELMDQAGLVDVTAARDLQGIARFALARQAANNVSP